MDARQWFFFFLKGISAVAAIVLLAATLLHFYGFGYDPQKITCLPYHFYIYEKKRISPTRVHRGDLIAFRMDRRGAPFFREGQLFIKMVGGVPGDVVEVRDGKVLINGKSVKSLNAHVMEKMGKRASDFDSQKVIARDELWVMGTNPRSFDSTYWGVLHETQIIGKVIWAR